jgi:hypothetical protein
MKRNIITVNQPAGLAITIVLDMDGTDHEILERVFGLFNSGSGIEHPEFMKHRMRSLSVNDFVRVNGNWYQCMSVGWKERDDKFVDQIEAAVVNHPLYAEYGEWFTLDRVMSEYRKSSGEKIIE